VKQLRPSTPSSCGCLHATTQLTAKHPPNASDVGGDQQVKKTKIASTSTTSTTGKIEKKRSRRRLRREFDDKTCQHCQTHYTSQWRTGPAGPSTYPVPPLHTLFFLLSSRTQVRPWSGWWRELCLGLRLVNTAILPHFTPISSPYLSSGRSFLESVSDTQK
jgi:hypothetical protein